jgi:hypothetical protein
MNYKTKKDHLEFTVLGVVSLSPYWMTTYDNASTFFAGSNDQVLFTK